MKLINKISELQEKFIVVFGNFDGMHKGHIHLIRNAQKIANETQCAVCIISFKPHPKHFFSPKNNYIISSDEQKKYAVELAGVKYFLEISFTEHCASLGAEHFLQEDVESSFFKGMHIGYDFALGKKREGNSLFLKQYCINKKILFSQSYPFYINKEVASSSLLRRELIDSNFKNVNYILGREYRLEGHVITGKGLGKTIGVPTINISCNKLLITPKQGVYRVDFIINNYRFRGITNIGINPTVDTDNEKKIETHILEKLTVNIQKGQLVEIVFIKRIRDEIKFQDINELKTQISEDIAYANTIKKI